MKKLQVMEEYYPNGIIFHLHGELNIHTFEKLKYHINYHFRKDIKEILLDFSNIFYIDSSGLSFLVNYNRLLKESGGHLWISNTRPEIDRIFKMVRMNNVFQFVSSDDVMNYLEKKRPAHSNRILLISSDISISEKILFSLREKNFNHTDHVETSKQALDIIDIDYDVVIYDVDIDEDESIIDYFIENNKDTPLILTSYKVKKKIIKDNNNKGIFMDKDIVNDPEAVSSLVLEALDGMNENNQDLLINYSSLKNNLNYFCNDSSTMIKLLSDILKDIDTYLILMDSNQLIILFSEQCIEIFPDLRKDIFACDSGVLKYIDEYTKDFFKGKRFNTHIEINNKEYSVNGRIYEENDDKYYVLYIKDENRITSDRNN